MITAEMIRSGQVVQGQTLYHVTARGSDGRPVRWKVTSVKLWKRHPERFELGLKHGLYAYDRCNSDYAHLLYADEQECLNVQCLEAMP